MMKKLILHFIILLLFILFNGCRTIKQECPENPAIGNMGEEINTFGDELNTTLNSDTLIFTTNGMNEEQIAENYFSPFEADDFLPKGKLYELISDEYYNVSTPRIIENPFTKQKEFYFSASLDNKINSTTDIFKSVNEDGVWSEPVKLKINSDYFEANPTFTDLGDIMIFSSDRNDGFGGMDLYLAELNDSGQWVNVVNMGEQINTRFNEITPFVDNNKDLWFSSNSASKSSMDIMKAEFNGENWNNKKIFPFPINTVEYQELSPCVIGKKLILSSNRPNGCGGFDLYSFDICAPVLLELNIISEQEDISINGMVRLFSDKDSLLNQKEVVEGVDLTFDLLSNENYLVEYENYCIKDNVYKYQISAPCSDSSVIKMVLNIPIKGDEEFSFSKYNIPFFVSGYYLPNTTENLNALKLKFDYNLIGNDPSTKYIERPKEKYDNIAPIVDSAMNDAVGFIMDKIKLISSPCSKGYKSIDITITGYSDPRSISDNAKYLGADINNKFIKVINGQKIDNQLLSELRAYYTAQSLIQKLKTDPIYKEYADKINWKIIGKGSLNLDNNNYELMRRADIEIKILK